MLIDGVWPIRVRCRGVVDVGEAQSCRRDVLVLSSTDYVERLSVSRACVLIRVVFAPSP